MTLDVRVAQLEAAYRHIAATRMAGLPLCHPGLQVAALGFEPLPGSGGALGVLLTPWFMNLVWLPMDDEPMQPTLGFGQTRARAVGTERFDFIGAHEPGCGAFEACSLFSPMAEFADQAAALATAHAVLHELRKPPEPPAAAPAVAAPARRSFLFGARGAA